MKSTTHDIEEIPGIGSEYGRRLREIDIRSVEDLALSRSEEVLLRLSDISPKSIEGWIHAARERAGENDLSRAPYEPPAPLVVNTDAESELFRGGHLVGGRRIRPRFSLLAGNGPPGETIRFESSAVAHLLGGRAWQWLGQVSGSLRAGEPTDLEFPESGIPPGIYRVDLEVRFGNNNP